MLGVRELRASWRMGKQRQQLGAVPKQWPPTPWHAFPNSSHPRGKGKRDGEMSPWSEALKLYKMVTFPPLPYRYAHLHLGPKPPICQA